MERWTINKMINGDIVYSIGVIINLMVLVMHRFVMDLAIREQEINGKCASRKFILRFTHFNCVFFSIKKIIARVCAREIFSWRICIIRLWNGINKKNINID